MNTPTHKTTPPPLERWLQMSVAMVAALGACLLSMEQQTAVLALIISAAAAASVYVTDIRGWVDLPRGFSNLVALVALILTLAQITRLGDGSDLLALANLLVYLQVVLLFQKKAERDYWQIISLSLLQVVVAAALNLSMLFGILLGFYFFAALASMTLLYLYRESHRGLSPIQSPPIPLKHIEPIFTRAPAAAFRDCGWRVVTIGLQTLLITVFIFFALPRLRGQEEPEASPHAIGMTGMSADVTLDDMERVLESPETVMRVTLSDGKTGKPFDFLGEPYFHGTVVIEYHDNGRWKYQHDTTIQALSEPPADANTVRQDVVLEPGRHPFLFGIAPAYRVPNRPSRTELGIEAFSHQLTIKDQERTVYSDPFSYSLITTGLARGIQDPFRPQPYGFRNSREYDICQEVSRNQFPVICQLADDILARIEPSPQDRVSICRHLEAHFLRSGEYKYLLGRSPQRRPDVDPIEDFVGNHKSGHCEYFASALALMLRSQGIPSRLVLGYKGGEYNELGKYYIVRQLHAHAWVEAYIPPTEALAAGVPAKSALHGVWLRLDPTPAGDGPNWEMPGIAFLNQFNQWMDYSQVVWNQYVLGMNSDRQRETVYQPIVDRVVRFGNSMVDPLAWESFFTSLGAQFGIDPNDIQRAMAWFITGVILVLLIGLGSVIQMARFLKQRWQRRKDWQGIPADLMARVPFYVQLEALLRAHGWSRRQEQTPQEVADVAALQMLRSGRSPHLASIPRQLVDAYYRVRYGQQSVDATERNRLTALVRELRQSLSQRQKPTATRRQDS